MGQPWHWYMVLRPSSLSLPQLHVLRPRDKSIPYYHIFQPLPPSALPPPRIRCRATHQGGTRLSLRVHPKNEKTRLCFPVQQRPNLTCGWKPMIHTNTGKKYYSFMPSVMLTMLFIIFNECIDQDWQILEKRSSFDEWSEYLSWS